MVIWYKSKKYYGYFGLIYKFDGYAGLIWFDNLTLRLHSKLI
jgi:hypothetical protein